MNLNLENFNIRRTNPYIAGPIGLTPGEERYIVKAQGLVGMEIFKEDKISIKNIEGRQECEIVAFNKDGNNKLGIIGQETNEDAKFITSAESLFSASSKESLVLVLFSKNKLAIVMSRSEGTFLIGRLITSLK